MMGSYLLLLYVSEEQEAAIECLFNQRNWLLDKIGTGTVKILKFQTPPKIAVIILKLEQYRFTTE